MTRIPTPSIGEPILIEGFEPQEVMEVFGFDDVAKTWLVSLENEAIVTIKFLDVTPDGFVRWKGEAPLWKQHNYETAEISDEEMAQEYPDGPTREDVIESWLSGALP